MMGEARRRGTQEERRAQAITRAIEDMPVRERIIRANSHAQMAVMLRDSITPEELASLEAVEPMEVQKQ